MFQDKFPLRESWPAILSGSPILEKVLQKLPSGIVLAAIPSLSGFLEFILRQTPLEIFLAPNHMLSQFSKKFSVTKLPWGFS